MGIHFESRPPPSRYDGSRKIKRGICFQADARKRDRDQDWSTCAKGSLPVHGRRFLCLVALALIQTHSQPFSRGEGQKTTSVSSLFKKERERVSLAGKGVPHGGAACNILHRRFECVSRGGPRASLACTSAVYFERKPPSATTA